MRVSVIIPAYNAERTLVEAVESLIQTGYSDLEIIIVDDGSKDSTLDVAHQLHSTYPGVVKVFHHKDHVNMGIACTRNLGIKQATGQLMCFLDSDDYVLANRFSYSVPLLMQNSQIDGVYEYEKMFYEGDQAQNDWWDSAEGFGMTTILNQEGQIQSLINGCPWSTNAILFRRSLLDRTGLFDERLTTAEDVNLWLKMACAGEIVAGDMSKAVCVYRRHENNTYQANISSRVDLIKAFLYVYQWDGIKHLSYQLQDLIFIGIREYIINLMIVARSGEQRQVAWQIVHTILKAKAFKFFLSRRMVGQILYLMCNK